MCPNSEQGRPAPEPSDVSLLKRLQEGSQTAATILYERYARRLRQLVEANCSAELARCLEPEDILQSVFRRFFEQARKGLYDAPSESDLWKVLLVIALNRVRDLGDFYRAAKRDVRLTVSGSSDETLLGQHLRDDSTNCFLRLVVEESLALLPPLSRTICELRLEGHEVAEISDQVGRSRRTVERLLQECRRRLLESLAG
jgi:RNA polymerase sigma-70 factor (ECF subfamily)